MRGFKKWIHFGSSGFCKDTFIAWQTIRKVFINSSRNAIVIEYGVLDTDYIVSKLFKENEIDEVLERLILGLNGMALYEEEKDE